MDSDDESIFLTQTLALRLLEAGTVVYATLDKDCPRLRADAGVLRAGVRVLVTSFASGLGDVTIRARDLVLPTAEYDARVRPGALYDWARMP